MVYTLVDGTRMVASGNALLAFWVLLILVQPKHVASRGKPKPTHSPSIRPTPGPSTSPSLQATSAPTLDRSEHPSRQPSKSPTFGYISTPHPTIQPTASSTLHSTAATLRIPTIQMTLILSPGLHSISDDMLQAKLTTFITVLLETKSGIETLDMVSLEFNILPSSFVHQNNVDSGFSIKIDGIIYYQNGAPSERNLQETMSELFSSGGIRELESFLHEHSFESAKVGGMYIDGKLVMIYNENGDKVIDTKHSGKSIGKKWKTLIASLVGLTAVSIVSCSIYWRSRKNNGTNDPTTSRPLFSKLRQHSSSDCTDNVTSSSDGEIVVHLAIKESELVLPYQQAQDVTSPGAYDARRLDRIIMDAKKHASIRLSSAPSRK